MGGTDHPGDPGYNDSDEEFRSIATFIRDEVGAETPWHISAFYPTYKLTDSHRTPAKTLEKALQIGIDAGLRYVYTGNIPGLDGENTLCYRCGRTVIKRYGFSIVDYKIQDGMCVFCGAAIDGVGL
jgi:pyruvate formate lyase activating enzyme